MLRLLGCRLESVGLLKSGHAISATQLTLLEGHNMINAGRQTMGLLILHSSRLSAVNKGNLMLAATALCVYKVGQ
jgi:hypothetical protein